MKKIPFILLMFSILIASAPATSAENKSLFDLHTANQILKQAEEDAKNMKIKLPHNDYDKEASLKAEQTLKKVRSESFQQKLQEQYNRLKSTLAKEATSQLLKGDKKPAFIQNSKEEDIRIDIFISSSMPLETIREYVHDAARLKSADIHFLLRGFVGKEGIKKITPTFLFFLKILKTDLNCIPDFTQHKKFGGCSVTPANIEIDPQRFRDFDVTQVPSFIFLSQKQKQKEHLKLSGDVSLRYVLASFRQASANKKLQAFISLLDRGQLLNGEQQ